MGEDWFEIAFNDVPIIAASFGWGSTVNNFVARADGVEIFNSGYVAYSSGTFSIEFDAPVQTLRFHDSGLGEVEIDNLDVTAVPIPGAALLLGSGILLLGLRKKLQR